MRLLPREQDRLLLFLAAELARKRRARGLALNQAEAVALIADEVCEAARDGRSYAQAEAAGYRALGPSDVAAGVAALLRRVEVEALFGDGSRLLVLHDPIAAAGPPERGEPALAWLARDRALTVVNEGEVAVGVTSHFHFFEVNRALRFDRAAAWGMRLAIAPGAKVFFDPGTPREVFLLPFGGARVIRGHGGLADGELDAPGALEAALRLARERGYRGA
jgi:urease subunit gamma/beta